MQMNSTNRDSNSPHNSSNGNSCDANCNHSCDCAISRVIIIIIIISNIIMSKSVSLIIIVMALALPTTPARLVFAGISMSRSAALMCPMSSTLRRRYLWTATCTGTWARTIPQIQRTS